VESTLVFAQTVRLRGRAVEWRSRPTCEANRGPSPPGKLGAMDHARRGESTPGFRGSRLVTEGCSAAFEGGESRKKPKRLRHLRFRTVGPWLYLGLDRRKGLYCAALKRSRSTPIRRFGRSKQTRLGRTSHGALPTARKLGETRVCVRDWQTQGDSTLRKKNGVSRRAWKRSRGCARTLQDSFADVDRRSWLREALPPLRSRSKEGPGDAVDGGLAYGCTESFLVESAVPGGPR